MSERLCAVGGSLELRPAGPPGFRLIAAVPAAPAPAPADGAPADGAPADGAADAAGGRRDATVAE